jgi:hypothetical protein
LCFKNKCNSKIAREVSYPDWNGIKTSPFDAAFTHNLDTFLTGLLREIYIEYIDYSYEVGEESFYYGDNLPKYSYDTLRCFLTVWEILSGLGLVGDDENHN